MTKYLRNQLKKESSFILAHSSGDFCLLMIAIIALGKADIMVRLHAERRCMPLGSQEAKSAVFLATGLQHCRREMWRWIDCPVGEEDTKTAMQLKCERLTKIWLWLQLIKVGTAGAEQALETCFHPGTEGTTNGLLGIWICTSIQKRLTVVSSGVTV